MPLRSGEGHRPKVKVGGLSCYLHVAVTGDSLTVCLVAMLQSVARLAKDFKEPRLRAKE